MLRGAVEQVMSDRVSGWIFSPVADVRGATLLAFVDEVCVGAGKVDILRPDLADAGLGDGRFGYSFPVTLNQPGDAGRLVVKLDGSDALLKQSTSQVQGPPAPGPAAPTGAFALSTSALHWMRSRGWLGQSDYDFLRYFSQLGVYDRTLAIPVERPDRIEVELRNEAEAAADILGLVCMRDPELKRVTVASAGDIAALVDEVGHKATPPVVALWSRERARLDVVEGSHLIAADEGYAPAVAVEYALGPDRLLILDARCIFRLGAEAPPSGIDVFTIGAA